MQKPIVKTEIAVVKTNPVVIDKLEEKTIAQIKPIPVVIKKSTEEITSSAAVISGRKSEFTQEVNYKSDSLILSLYDNGEIDGDTVSVYMNGEVLMAKQGLKASAIKKTIYISPDTEDFTLVLFAENLGKYPPIPDYWLCGMETKYIISGLVPTFRKIQGLCSSESEKAINLYSTQSL